MKSANIDTQSVWQMDRDHVIHPYTDFSTFAKEGSQVITNAEGAYVVDAQGNRFLDGIAGLWCVNIGHGRREMAEAIAEQVLTMEYYNPFGHTTNAPASILANKLSQLAPGSLNHVFIAVVAPPPMTRRYAWCITTTTCVACPRRKRSFPEMMPITVVPMSRPTLPASTVPNRVSTEFAMI